MDISVFNIIYPSMSEAQQLWFYDIFNDLNKNVFENKLNKVQHLGVFENLEFDGLTMRIRPEDKKPTKNKPTGAVAVLLSPIFDRNIEQTRNTAAHELIHVFQAQNEQNLNHGRLFKHYQAEIAYYYGVKQGDI